jgi:hypothetical protein
MPRETITVELSASCDEAFAVIHDYGRRLAWDTMLREARLLDGATAAGLGVRSRCAGKWRGAYLALETEYIQFAPGRVAAVTMTNHPPFFAHFAATMRHGAISATHSRLVYTYSFRARPRWLAFVLEPLMNAMLRRETRQRLRALGGYLASRTRADNHSNS